LSHQGVGGFQGGLRQGVAEKVGVGVPQLLVQQVDHHAVLTTTAHDVLMQGLCQQHRRGRVGHPVHLKTGHIDGFGAVVFEDRRAVDHRIQHAELRHHGGHQVTHAGFDREVSETHHGWWAVGVDRVAVGGGLFGLAAGVAVVHGDLPARPRQRQGDFAPQAFARASDEHGA